MAVVFLLQHSYEIDGIEETKIIGIYSSKVKAESVVERYKTLPGFENYPNCFSVDEYKIDKDNWIEGFNKME